MTEAFRSDFTVFRYDDLDRTRTEHIRRISRSEFISTPRISLGTMVVYVVGHKRWDDLAEYFRAFQLMYPIRIIIVGTGGEYGFPDKPMMRVCCAMPEHRKAPFCIEEILLPEEPDIEGTSNGISSLADADLPLYLAPLSFMQQTLLDKLCGDVEALIIPTPGMVAGGEETVIRDLYMGLGRYKTVIDMRWPSVLTTGRRLLNTIYRPMSGAVLDMRFSADFLSYHTSVLMAAMTMLFSNEEHTDLVAPIERGFIAFRKNGRSIAVYPTADLPKGQGQMTSPENPEWTIGWEAPLDHVHLGDDKHIQPIRRKGGIREGLAEALPSFDQHVPADVIKQVAAFYYASVRSRAVLRFELPEVAAYAAAQYVRAAILGAVAARGVATIALSGGETPKLTYSALRSSDCAGIPWDKVHVFFSDERAVTPDNPRSNYLLAKIGLIEPLGIPGSNVHRILGEAPNLEAEAMRYSQEIASVIPAAVGEMPVMDCILLGMGSDGHTASIFPGSRVIGEKEKLVSPSAATTGEKRITFTFPLINSARSVLVLAAGKNKAEPLSNALGATPSASNLPIAKVHPKGVLSYFVDVSAMSLE